ncbi:DUF1080 domain-containing protein [Parvularcula flava]|uniref:DUF1080 domain-containing protein n=1 Tax=Aquisalinus luteolus TaxID=1566827 RepID=A0A8J3ESP5_9PROT|nr:family 16 glycoside hydrolase [Aquisalinus luteolus]NHK29466.1 DUF1080 domain-containing protein [Aquisalinus luteolus]GGI01859.1 hypothetical protein GCM10011355_33490 [Aquisalinus luteolus]
MYRKLMLAGAALGALAACGERAETSLFADGAVPERGHEPWIARSVLDGEPRMLTLALSDNLWIAYSTEDATLRSAWSAPAIYEGAVYDGAHGPQPHAPEARYVLTTDDDSWRLMEGSESVPAQVRYLGHKVRDGRIALNYRLTAPSGAFVDILEHPEAGGAGESATLERRFEITTNEGQLTPVLAVTLQSLKEQDSLATNAEWVDRQVRRLDTGYTVTGDLLLRKDGITSLSASFGEPKVSTVSESNVAAPAADERFAQAQSLMQSTGCYSCHAEDTKIIGPSYADVRERYEATRQNVSQLAGKIISGGAGVWGEVPMTAHPQLSQQDAESMMAYILQIADLPDEAEPEVAQATEEDFTPVAPPPEGYAQGFLVEFYEVGERLEQLPVLDADARPNDVVRVTHPSFALDPWTVNLESQRDMAGGKYIEATNFVARLSGQIHIPENGTYYFRMSPRNGTGQMRVAGTVLVDTDRSSSHGGEITLTAGWHPIEVEVLYYGAGESQALISASGPGLEQMDFLHGRYVVAPIGAEEKATAQGVQPFTVMPPATVPGDGIKLTAMHPAYDLSQARPDSFDKRIGAMDFLSDGRLVVSAWDGEGGVYILDGVTGDDPEAISVRQIAFGLAEPLGLKVVDDEIYVMQKQELTKLVDVDGDEIIDDYVTVSNDWAVTDNFHEFGFGLVHRDGKFYATLAAAVMAGGSIAENQGEGRGSVIEIDPETGEARRYAHGFRAPNGVGEGPDGALYVSDNEGNWLPASKIVRVEEGGFYGYRSIDWEADKDLKEDPPLIWLPHFEIGNSPTQMVVLEDGPYAGQLLHGDIHHGGYKRTAMDEVGGVAQGCVFRFAQGLESASHRLVKGPDGAIYAGQLGVGGNWGVPGLLTYGLQKMRYNGTPAFEMLSVRTMNEGLEIVFTEPLAAGTPLTAEDVTVTQWRYEPTVNYGGPKLDERELAVASVRLSGDRQRAYLTVPGIEAGHVVHLNLSRPPAGESGREIWSPEAFCTVNAVPTDRAFPDGLAASGGNVDTISGQADANDWQILFDGESLDGWRGYGREAVPGGWRVENGAITMAQTGTGDLITRETFEDFELLLDWRIAEGGNSGVFYHVTETEQGVWSFETAAEYQLLDDDAHPDGRIPSHRSGALYDMVVPAWSNARPIGEWNRTRIIVTDGRVEHWLNGRKLVEAPYRTGEWGAMVADSKFADMPHFARTGSGHIGLQDHGDRVWFRNIRIRPL